MDISFSSGNYYENNIIENGFSLLLFLSYTIDCRVYKCAVLKFIYEKKIRYEFITIFSSRIVLKKLVSIL